MILLYNILSTSVLHDTEKLYFKKLSGFLNKFNAYIPTRKIIGHNYSNSTNCSSFQHSCYTNVATKCVHFTTNIYYIPVYLLTALTTSNMLYGWLALGGMM